MWVLLICVAFSVLTPTTVPTAKSIHNEKTKSRIKLGNGWRNVCHVPPKEVRVWAHNPLEELTL
jgi:hypothetical protein